MKPVGRFASCLFAIVIAGGCASTRVTDSQVLVTEKIPRPNHILVHDFVATPADVPADSSIADVSAASRTPQTAEQIETGRQVGADIAARLVEEIRDMGLPAERASARAPEITDIMIRGYLLSIEEGSTARRVGIGFGTGASRLSVAVEGYQMTAEGPRKLASGTMAAGGGKAPGAAAPLGVLLATGNPIGLVVSTGMKVYGEASGRSRIEGRAEQVAKEIAKRLEPRFRQQGWIK